MIEHEQAAKLLAIKDLKTSAFTNFRAGARTRAVIATHDGVAHRFREDHESVVVKLYKGPGTSSGSLGYQHYHNRDFHNINALMGNNHLQKSIAGGVMEGVGPYAVVQHIKGEELAVRLKRATITKKEATRILRDIIELIWIPLWHEGLRFKDSHPGNFVLTADTRVVMIDTEQMRKGTRELLQTPTDWSQRNKHQEMGLRRVPGLIKRVVETTPSELRSATMLRQIKASLDESGLPETLGLLGKPDGSVEAALQASNTMFNNLTELGLIE